MLDGLSGDDLRAGCGRSRPNYAKLQTSCHLPLPPPSRPATLLDPAPLSQLPPPPTHPSPPLIQACHRLDQWTTGIVVMSRNKEASKAFKRALQDRKAGLVKTYKALTAAPVPVGPLQHHVYDGPFNEGAPVLGGGNLRPRGPRLLSASQHARWRVCKLDVKECKVGGVGCGWVGGVGCGLQASDQWLLQRGGAVGL